MVRKTSFVLAVITAGALAVSPNATAEPLQPKGKPARVASSAKVTLITGDVAKVDTFADGRRQVTVLAPDGGPGRDALTYGRGKHLYVVPTEALPRLREGRLDQRLFDVAGLIEQGYDDAKSRSIPLIVTGGAAPLTASARQLSSVHGYAATVDKSNTRELWQQVSAAAPQKIWLDGRVKVTLEQSVPQVGAPTAWQRGFDGTGTTVAVLDTGVDATHPDLAGKVDATENFTPEPTADDEHGHGTHVAATVAGTGNGSQGRRKGVAPGARLISGRVLDRDGFGDESWIIAGMEWAAAKGADVVNVSIGGDPTDGTDPMSVAVNELTARTGTLFVIAAGNLGPSRFSVMTPGAADAALTVGSVTKSDELSSFSSRGPRLGDNAVKPEITAPGSEIIAARAKGTSMGSPVDDLYTSADGTSMATPHVAGAAAILAQRHADWSAPQLKAALAGSAKPSAEADAFEQGAGRLDVPRALDATTVATPTTLNFGFFKWPNQNQPPVARKLSYRNTSTTPTTVDLAAALDHGSVPDGGLTLSTRELTIPAGGTAEATITVTPGKFGTGDLSGVVTATARGSGQITRVPFSFGVEPESYELTLRSVGRDGAPAPGVVELWKSGWEAASYIQVFGEQRIRLPKAEYSAVGFGYTADGPRITDLIVGGDPEVVLDRDTTVTIDARASKDVSVRVPDQDAQVRGLLVTWSRRYSDAELQNSPYLFFQRRIPRVSVIPSDPVRHGKFEFATGWRLTAPELRMTAGKTAVDATPAFGSPRLTGKHRLPVVDAGAGRPGDFAKARGALALVAASDELSALEQATNAAKAGARGLLIADEGLAGFFGTAWGAPIPVISVPDPTAIQELIKRNGRLDVDGAGHSPYVYNLMLPVRQAIPATARYDIKRGDLATVTNTFYGVAPGRPTWESHSGWRPDSLNNIAGTSDITEPLTRREYISPGDTQWQQTVQVPATVAEAPVMYSGRRFYKRGDRLDQTWWRGPLTPTTGSENQTVIAGRDGDLIMLGIDDYQDAEPYHWGQPYLLVGPDATTTARIFRDGKLISESHHAWGDYEVGPEPSTYRVEHTVDRTAPWWSTSTKTATTWTFRSARPKSPGTHTLPIIDLDWSLPLGLQNNAQELTVLPVTVRAGHIPGATARPVGRIDAWVSYDDGRQWYRLGLWREGNSYRGVILNLPKHLTSGHVSLRATVADGDGNRIDQTLIRAYSLTGRR
jgi:subtilisin family serine protease